MLLLPLSIALPTGATPVAELNGEITDCGLIHQLEPEVSEIKRVFVSGKARELQLGLNLVRKRCTVLINQARANGFAIIRLDSGNDLKEATGLCQSPGFKGRAPYWDVPADLANRLRF